MENYSHSSYPDSRDSSPRSREIDNENSSFEEPPPSNNNYKVKFMCSYGGKIQPRAHDNQLAYVGGDTKILAVDRNIKFSVLMAKLSSLSNADVCFKYQLPGEDLDALISVTNEEDLEHMMVEYDRLCRASVKPARLRLFLFPLNPSSAPTNFGTNELKPERQWLVDALNSLPIPPMEGSPLPPPVSAANPDFLFGLDKGYPVVQAHLPDSAPALTVPDIPAKDLPARSECGSEDRQVVGEPVVSPTDVQRQIQELQKLQLGNYEQLLQQRKIDEENGRVYNMDYYPQKNPEKLAHAYANVHSASVSIPVPVSVQASPAAFLPERHLTSGGYSFSGTGAEPPVYLIQTMSGMYQAMRPITTPIGQTYYAAPRMVQPAEVYTAAPPPVPISLSHSNSQPKIAYNGTEVGAVPEHGYSQVAYPPDKSTIRRQAAAAAAPAHGGDSWN